MHFVGNLEARAKLKKDLKFSLIATLVISLPAFWLFGTLWNPHGSSWFFAQRFVGMAGIAPFVFVVAYFGEIGMSSLGIVVGAVAEYLWLFFWVYLIRRLWGAFRGGNAL